MNRARKLTFLIYTEGLSEAMYFQSLNQLDFVRKSKYKLEVENCKELDKLCKIALDPTRQERKRMKEVAKIAFVFDKDHLTMELFQKMLATEFIIGYSSPQFEVWLLAHFDRIRSSYSDVLKSLSEFIPNYTKSSLKISDLAKDYSKALKNLEGMDNAKFDEVCSTVGNVIKEITK
jgi:hypothetical protein